MPLYIERTRDGGVMFIHGNLGAHCSECCASADYLCDFPVQMGRTCDLPLCASHAYELAPEIHYCPNHLQMQVLKNCPDYEFPSVFDKNAPRT
jgi:hypothetical protein